MNFRALIVSNCLLWVGADAAAPPATKSPAPSKEAMTLPSPDYLPPLARQLLRKRMEQHGRDQIRLLTAVTLLQRDTVKVIASDLAAEPRIVRPMPDSRDDLNAALPEKFFVYQDALRLRAKDLAAAASVKDDVGLARSFGQLVETCVGCHSAFLNDAPR